MTVRFHLATSGCVGIERNKVKPRKTAKPDGPYTTTTLKLAATLGTYPAPSRIPASARLARLARLAISLGLPKLKPSS